MTDDRRPLVSVGMPVYNGENHITKALDSLLVQTYGNFEVIIADNASTDGTPEICREYADRDRRVTYHRNGTNMGAAWNFTHTLALSAGKYFTWFAHDDTCDRRYLQLMVEFLEDHSDVVACGCSMQVLDGSDNVVRTEPLEEILPRIEWQVARSSFFRVGRGNTYLMIYGLYRRESIMAMPIVVREYSGKLILDQSELPFLSRVAVAGRMVALPEPVRSYRRHGESSWHREKALLSRRDMVRLEDDMRLHILGVASSAALPFSEKLRVVFTALSNFGFRLPRLIPLLGTRLLGRKTATYRYYFPDTYRNQK